MRGRAASILFLIGALTLAVDAGAADPFTLQPVEGDRGLAVWGDGATVWAVTGDGSARRLPLGRGEQPTAVAETADGWVTAGLRRRPDRRELFLMEERNGEIRRLAPPRGAAMLRLRPVPLVDGGELAGLAWLEGDSLSTLEVRAAALEDGRWSAPVTVSPAGRGSQTGLVGAVLADGAWLLAWAAFDGNDDEILFAERRGGSWSSPRRVHPGNRVPDVTPALLPTSAGARLVWAHRDDEEGYRLTLSTFDGNRWSAPAVVGGPHTLYPAFTRLGGRDFLLARSAAPRGWRLLEVGADARVTRSALTTEASSVRPTVETVGDDVLLRWPGEPGGRAVSWRRP